MGELLSFFHCIPVHSPFPFLNALMTETFLSEDKKYKHLFKLEEW